MYSHYLVEHNIKIEDQIWPNLPLLAKVFNIQSSGAVNLKFLIAFYVGDGAYNPDIKKFFKCWNLDVSSTSFKHLNDFFRKTLNLMAGSVIRKRKHSDDGLVNPSKKLKLENTILNKVDNKTKCDDDDHQAYGRLVYNSDLVHSEKEVKIMTVNVEIP